MEKLHSNSDANPLEPFGEHNRLSWSELLMLGKDASWEDIKTRIAAEQAEAEVMDNLELSDSLARDMHQVERGFAPSTEESEEEIY